MKKTRIDLSASYPKYFAVIGRAEAFAELSDADIETLDKLEAALPGAAPAAQAPAETAAEAPEAPEAAGLQALEARLTQQEQEIQALREQIAKGPAAAHTAVGSDASAEGGDAGAAAKSERVISETEALLNELRGKK